MSSSVSCPYSSLVRSIQRDLYVVDATDVVLGRLAAQIATLLRGKHKPTFAPHVDGGDFVVVINADKVALTGAKLEQKKRSEERRVGKESRSRWGRDSDKHRETIEAWRGTREGAGGS